MTSRWTNPYYGVQHLRSINEKNIPDQYLCHIEDKIAKNQYTLEDHNSFVYCFVRIVGSGSLCHKENQCKNIEEAKEWLIKMFNILEG